MTPRPDHDPALDALLRGAARAQSSELDRTPSCPDASVLAAWAEGALRASEAEALEGHVADCAYCGATLAAFVRTAPLVPPQPFWRRWAVLVPIGLAAATAAAVSWFVVAPRTSPAPLPATTVAETQPPASSSRPAPVAEPASPPPAHPATAGRPHRENPPASAPPKAALQRTVPAGASADASPQAQAKAVTEEAARVNTSKASPPAPVTAPPPTVVSATPPPPPPAAAASAAAPAFRSAVAPAVIAEFGPPGDAVAAAEATNADLASTTARGAAGRGGLVNVGNASGQQLSANAIGASLRTLRWRVLASGAVERTPDSSTWLLVAIDPPAFITAGVAPSATECWLVGRHGAVVVWTLGQSTHVDLPEPVDLVSIAVLGTSVTVKTADGVTWTSVDRGRTWTK